MTKDKLRKIKIDNDTYLWKREHLHLTEYVHSITLVNDKIEFWIWNNAGPKYKLRFETFSEYLETGISCSFCIFWQYFYLDTEALDFNDPFTKEWIANNFNGAISRMKTALASMKEYFPEEDWSYQEGEMERVKGK